MIPFQTDSWSCNCLTGVESCMLVTWYLKLEETPMKIPHVSPVMIIGGLSSSFFSPVILHLFQATFLVKLESCQYLSSKLQGELDTTDPEWSLPKVSWSDLKIQQSIITASSQGNLYAGSTIKSCEQIHADPRFQKWLQLLTTTMRSQNRQAYGGHRLGLKQYFNHIWHYMVYATQFGLLVLTWDWACHWPSFDLEFHIQCPQDYILQTWQPSRIIAGTECILALPEYLPQTLLLVSLPIASSSLQKIAQNHDLLEQLLWVIITCESWGISIWTDEQDSQVLSQLDTFWQQEEYLFSEYSQST